MECTKGRKEQIQYIQFWWKDFGDIRRWPGWEKNKKHFRALDALLEIRDHLNKTIDGVVQKLGGKNEMSKM